MKKLRFNFMGIALVTLCSIFTGCSDLDEEFFPIQEEGQTITDLKSCSTDPEDPEDPGNTNTGCGG